MLGEQKGFDLILLPSVISSVKTERLSLKDRSEELPSLLQFHRAQDLENLQTGEPLALFACLFLRGAITSAFVQHFFLGFRYFATPAQLLAFLTAVVRVFGDRPGRCQQDDALARKAVFRAAHVCAVWIADFYSIDFQVRVKVLRQFF